MYNLSEEIRDIYLNMNDMQSQSERSVYTTIIMGNFNLYGLSNILVYGLSETIGDLKLNLNDMLRQSARSVYTTITMGVFIF